MTTDKVPTDDRFGDEPYDDVFDANGDLLEPMDLDARIDELLGLD